jgi:integrase
MKIELRNRTLPSGNRSLYLEFYEKGGKRTYESLNLFFIPEKDDNDRRVNENTLSHALKIKAERILGIEKENDDDKKPNTRPCAFADWMDEYEVYLKEEKKASASYCRRIHSSINIVKSYLNHIRRPRMRFDKVDKTFYKKLLAYMKDVYRNTRSPDNPKPLSPKTLHLTQTNLNTMLKYAVAKGVLQQHPCYELDAREKFQKTPSTREYLTVEELKALADAPTGSPITKQTFLFCCFTGLRHSDMIALRWKDIQKTDDGDMIHISSMQKTGKPVIIPLGIQARTWLPERNEASPEDRVFANVPSLCSANRALKRLAKKAGITKTVSFHTSRHTFATMTLTAGGDLYTTSKLLGHTNIHTTEIYADVVMEKKADAVNLMNGLFG